MSARDEIMGLASRISAGLSPEWCDEMREHMDAYAHELAEKQRAWARETVGGGAVGAVCLKAIDGAADFIDPEVSSDG